MSMYAEKDNQIARLEAALSRASKASEDFEAKLARADNTVKALTEELENEVEDAMRLEDELMTVRAELAQMADDCLNCQRALAGLVIGLPLSVVMPMYGIPEMAKRHSAVARFKEALRTARVPGTLSDFLRTSPTEFTASDRRSGNQLLKDLGLPPCDCPDCTKIETGSDLKA